MIFLDSIGAELSLEPSILLLEQNLCKYSIQWPIIIFFLSDWWEQSLFLALSDCWAVSSDPCRWYFLLALVSFFTCRSHFLLLKSRKLLFPFPVSWFRNSLRTGSWGNRKIHIVSHFSEVAVLCCLMYSVLKAVFHIFGIFVAVSGRRVNWVPFLPFGRNKYWVDPLPLVDPSWLPASLPLILLLKSETHEHFTDQFLYLHFLLSSKYPPPKIVQ